LQFETVDHNSDLGDKKSLKVICGCLFLNSVHLEVALINCKISSSSFS